MNTKSIVSVSVLIFVTLVSILYAFVQQTAAERARLDAEEQKYKADAARLEAEEQKLVADKVMAQYQMALRDLEHARQKCK